MPAPTCPTLDHVCDLVFVEDAPACFGVVAEGGRLSLRDGPHLARVDDLIGFTAPVSWAGVAFVGDGRGIPLDGGPEQRLRVTFVLTRDGAHASSITSEVGSSRSGGPGLVDDRPRGHVADLCHRSLGLDAAPEASTPDDVDLANWLDDVLRLHDQLGPAFDLDDWPGLVSLHPRLGAPSSRTWVDIHCALVELGCGWGNITADEVAWMDPPTWARYVLDEAPRIEPLLVELGHLLSTDAMTHVHSMLLGGADSVRGGDRGGGE